jgi:ACR3 family arsenite efflux pump ArsB
VQVHHIFFTSIPPLLLYHIIPFFIAYTTKYTRERAKQRHKKKYKIKNEIVNRVQEPPTARKKKEREE